MEAADTDKTDYTGYWRPAGRREILLIKAWEEAALKRHMLKGFGNIFLIAAFCIFLIVSQYSNMQKYETSMVSSFLLLFLALAVILAGWWALIYFELRELWHGRIYVRNVVCTGRTLYTTRYRREAYLDAAGEAGDILEEIEVPIIVADCVKNQDIILAVTGTPGELRPLRLVPFQEPPKLFP